MRGENPACHQRAASWAPGLDVLGLLDKADVETSGAPQHQSMTPVMTVAAVAAVAAVAELSGGDRLAPMPSTPGRITSPGGSCHSPARQGT